jgi:hypothetical protein
MAKKRRLDPIEVERARQEAEKEAQHLFSPESLGYMRRLAFYWEPADRVMGSWGASEIFWDRLLLNEMQQGIEMRYLWPYYPREANLWVPDEADRSAEHAARRGISWPELIAREAQRCRRSWSLIASLAPIVEKVKKVPAITGSFWEPDLRKRQRGDAKKAKAKAKATRRAKAYEAAVVYAYERLRPFADDGWFKPDYDQVTEEESAIAVINTRACAWHDDFVKARKASRLVEQDGKPEWMAGDDYHEYLSHIFEASWRPKSFVQEVRDYVAALPECPDDVRDYILNRLLPNFQDTSRLMGVRPGAGAREKSDRNTVIAQTVEIICLRFKLSPKKNRAGKAKAGCQCVAEALNDLGVDIKYSGVVEVYDASLAPILVRAIAGKYQKLLGVPLHEAPFLLGPPRAAVAKAAATKKAELQGETI